MTILRFKCPLCDSESYNPTDAQYHYCGRCHLFIDDVALYFDLDLLRKAFKDLKGKDEGPRNWFIRRLVESRESR